MNLVESLLERYFRAENGELCLGDVPVTRLAEAYGTPLFVYDRRVLDLKLERLRAALPPEFSIHYSVKANPHPRILKHFLEGGCSLEIASAGEFHLALTAGCAAAKIVFAGPGKTDSELRTVIAKGIGELHVESLNEALRISSIARDLNANVRIAIRVNPSSEVQGGAMRMGGKPAPFGIDEEQLDEVLDSILQDTRLQVTGIHLFVGTQILDHEILTAQYRKALEIARRVAARLGGPVRTVDFGGGFGIPYFLHERELDTDALAAGLRVLMEEVRSDPAFRGTRFLVEPGRYLIGEAGVYVTRIVDIKISRLKKFVIVDGGMNHHLAASGNLGQTIKRNYPVALLTRLHEPADQAVDVVGPLCTPLDVLARSVVLPEPSVGDLVGVFQSGAYARTASPLGFLSHPTPPEVWVDSGRHELIRRRGDLDDYLRDVCLPATVGAS